MSEFILRRSERRQERYDDALKRTSEFEEVLGQRADLSGEISSLKSALLNANATSQRAHERHRREMFMVKQTLSDPTSQLLQQLTFLQNRLEKPQAVHNQFFSDHATWSAASDQLRRELVDRNKDRDQAVFYRDSL